MSTTIRAACGDDMLVEVMNLPGRGHNRQFLRPDMKHGLVPISCVGMNDPDRRNRSI
jgi:hypothetical protein